MTTDAKTAEIAAGYDAIADEITMPAEFYDRLRRTVGDIRGMHVLDAGCGNGYFLQRLLQSGAASLTGAEFSPELCRRAQARFGDTVTVCRMNLEEPLPFADHTFDRITMSEVIEHLPHPIVALRNLSRVLRPGGKLFMTFPNAGAYPLWKLGEKHFDHPLGFRAIPIEHPRKTFQPIDALLTPTDIRGYLAEAGLRPVKWSGHRPWPWWCETRFRRPYLLPLNLVFGASQVLGNTLRHLPFGYHLCYRVTVTCVPGRER